MPFDLNSTYESGRPRRRTTTSTQIQKLGNCSLWREHDETVIAAKQSSEINMGRACAFARCFRYRYRPVVGRAERGHLWSDGLWREADVRLDNEVPIASL